MCTSLGAHTQSTRDRCHRRDVVTVWEGKLGQRTDVTFLVSMDKCVWKEISNLNHWFHAVVDCSRETCRKMQNVFKAGFSFLFRWTIVMSWSGPTKTQPWRVLSNLEKVSVNFMTSQRAQFWYANPCWQWKWQKKGRKGKGRKSCEGRAFLISAALHIGKQWLLHNMRPWKVYSIVWSFSCKQYWSREEIFYRSS